MTDPSTLPIDRITTDPKIRGGRACIRGMRITVSLVLRFLAVGMTHEEILAAYPYLEAEDIRAALRYAAALTASPPAARAAGPSAPQ